MSIETTYLAIKINEKDNVAVIVESNGLAERFKQLANIK